MEKLTLCTVTAASTAAQDEPELSVVCLSDLPAEIDNALDTYLSMIKAAGLKERPRRQIARCGSGRRRSYGRATMCLRYARRASLPSSLAA